MNKEKTLSTYLRAVAEVDGTETAVDLNGRIKNLVGLSDSDTLSLAEVVEDSNGIIRYGGWGVLIVEKDVIAWVDGDTPYLRSITGMWGFHKTLDDALAYRRSHDPWRMIAMKKCRPTFQGMRTQESQ